MKIKSPKRQTPNFLKVSIEIGFVPRMKKNMIVDPTSEGTAFIYQKNKKGTPKSYRAWVDFEQFRKEFKLQEINRV